MDEDRVGGSAKDWAGKAEDTVGDITGDADAQVRGRAREVAGQIQNLFGQAKDTARDAADAAMSLPRAMARRRLSSWSIKIRSAQSYRRPLSGSAWQYY